MVCVNPANESIGLEILKLDRRHRDAGGGGGSCEGHPQDGHGASTEWTLEHVEKPRRDYAFRIRRIKKTSITAPSMRTRTSPTRPPIGNMWPTSQPPMNPPTSPKSRSTRRP